MARINLERDASLNESAERTEEIKPEHSAEVEQIIERLDQGIEDSESLLGGLGRLALEHGMVGGDEQDYKQIYTRRQIGRMDLKAEHDAEVFGEAGTGLKARNLLSRFLTLGLRGSKYVMEGRGMNNFDKTFDTRTLKPEAKDKAEKLTGPELEEAIGKSGLTPEEVKKQGLNFFKTYVETAGGRTEKVISRSRTEEEIEETAGDILDRRLEELEETAGADLIKKKESLEGFRKEVEDNRSLLEPEDIAKLEDEARSREDLIEGNRQDLNYNLDTIRTPLSERQGSLDRTLLEATGLLAEASGQENEYKTRIRTLQEKITKIGRTKAIRESLGDRMAEWEQQKEQAQVNLSDFLTKKEALSNRIAELKTEKAKVDKMLARINNIGKTPAELKAKKEAGRQAAEAARSAAQTGGSKPNVAPKLESLDDDEARATLHGAGNLDGDTEIDDSSDDSPDKPIVAQAGASGESDHADAAAEKLNAEQEAENRRINEIERAAKTTVEDRQQGEAVVSSAPDRQREAREKIRPTRDWLNGIFKIKLPNEAEQVMKKHFRVGPSFDLTAPMTLAQAMDAYAGYLQEFKGVDLVKARATTLKHFQRIFGIRGDVILAAAPVADRLNQAGAVAETEEQDKLAGSPEQYERGPEQEDQESNDLLDKPIVAKTGAGEPVVDAPAVGRPTATDRGAVRVEAPVQAVGGAAGQESAPDQQREIRERTKPTRYWLNGIFKIILPHDAEEVMKKHFRVGQEFDLAAPMALAQAMEAYVGYLQEFKGMDLSKARTTTLKHFERTYGIKARAGATAAETPKAGQPAGVEQGGTLDDLARGMDKDLAGATPKPDAAVAPGQPTGVDKGTKTETTPGGEDSGKPKVEVDANVGAAAIEPVDASRQGQTTPEAEAGGKPIVEADANVGSASVEPGGSELAQEPGSELTGVGQVDQSEKGGQPAESETTMSTKKWLEKFDLGKVNKVIKAHFTLPDRNFNKSVPMTEGQARAALEGYLKGVNHLPDEEATKRVKKLMDDKDEAS